MDAQLGYDIAQPTTFLAAFLFGFVCKNKINQRSFFFLQGPILYIFIPLAFIA